MRENAKRATRRYLLVLVACLAVAYGCLRVLRGLVYAPIVSLVLTVLLFAALLLIVVMGVVTHAMRKEARDWDATCEPLIAQYEATGDVDQFVGGYESWRLGQHTSVTRYEFLERICSLLARDGHDADAQVALSGLSNMAETRRQARRYQEFRARCLETISEQEDARAAEAEDGAGAGVDGPEDAADLTAASEADAFASLDDLDGIDIDEIDANAAAAGMGEAPALATSDVAAASEVAEAQASGAPAGPGSGQGMDGGGPAQAGSAREGAAGEAGAPAPARHGAHAASPDGAPARPARPARPEVESTIDLLRSAGVKPGAWDTSYKGGDGA